MVSSVLRAIQSLRHSLFHVFFMVFHLGILRSLSRHTVSFQTRSQVEMFFPMLEWAMLLCNPTIPCWHWSGWQSAQIASLSWTTPHWIGLLPTGWGWTHRPSLKSMSWCRQSCQRQLRPSGMFNFLLLVNIFVMLFYCGSLIAFHFQGSC